MKTVTYLRTAQRGLRRYETVAARIMAKVDEYAANPDAFPEVRQLRGSTGKRLRVGNFRVLFEETETEIIVTDIGPRGSIYE